MNHKCNDLGNVFLFRGKKTGFTFVLPLVLFTNQGDLFATAKGKRMRSLSNTLPLGGAAKLHQIQCLSAHSPPPVKYQEETGLNAWFNKPAATFTIISYQFYILLSSAAVSTPLVTVGKCLASVAPRGNEFHSNYTVC